ncbi:hypothetical protein [Actinokineospora globicatena]|uniref:hypothetical protein n=1 Tax=Actinokineospora globicatena TaxID=103729 RepID=UPI0020A25FE5|nr:hypothetical protein [Actinokineospora globicatena]MCP2301143.1 hypothetical protein [Actinokineospora globicatena]GLW77221.1 hypothetical protein Aglo01_17030 [Actinokineospora globicatena]GLW84055.1 hypothetical protein Aglo02_16950 [Actinokineospora globicatena]
MHSGFHMNTWAKVDDDCEITYSPDGPAAMSLYFGGRMEGFEIVLTRTTLDRLAAVAAEARDKLAA